MDKSIVRILTIGMLGLIVVVGCSTNPNPSEENLIQEKQLEQSFETKSTGSTEMGDVIVELTPHNINEGKLNVAISVNTHSVNLDQFDLHELTTLEFGGQSIKPISAPRLAGHHSSGTITFEMATDVDSFTILIEGIPKQEQRTFTWN